MADVRQVVRWSRVCRLWHWIIHNSQALWTTCPQGTLFTAIEFTRQVQASAYLEGAMCSPSYPPQRLEPPRPRVNGYTSPPAPLYTLFMCFSMVSAYRRMLCPSRLSVRLPSLGLPMWTHSVACGSAGRGAGACDGRHLLLIVCGALPASLDHVRASSYRQWPVAVDRLAQAADASRGSGAPCWLMVWDMVASKHILLLPLPLEEQQVRILATASEFGTAVFLVSSKGRSDTHVVYTAVTCVLPPRWADANTASRVEVDVLAAGTQDFASGTALGTVLAWQRGVWVCWCSTDPEVWDDEYEFGTIIICSGDGTLCSRSSFSCPSKVTVLQWPWEANTTAVHARAPTAKPGPLCCQRRLPRHLLLAVEHSASTLFGVVRVTWPSAMVTLSGRRDDPWLWPWDDVQWTYVTPLVFLRNVVRGCTYCVSYRCVPTVVGDDAIEIAVWVRSAPQKECHRLLDAHALQLYLGARWDPHQGRWFLRTSHPPPQVCDTEDTAGDTWSNAWQEWNGSVAAEGGLGVPLQLISRMGSVRTIEFGARDAPWNVAQPVYEGTSSVGTSIHALGFRCAAEAERFRVDDASWRHPARPSYCVGTKWHRSWLWPADSVLEPVLRLSTANQIISVTKCGTVYEWSPELSAGFPTTPAAAADGIGVGVVGGVVVVGGKATPLVDKLGRGGLPSFQAWQLLDDPEGVRRRVYVDVEPSAITRARMLLWGLFLLTVCGCLGASLWNHVALVAARSRASGSSMVWCGRVLERACSLLWGYVTASELMCTDASQLPQCSAVEESILQLARHFAQAIAFIMWCVCSRCLWFAIEARALGSNHTPTSYYVLLCVDTFVASITFGPAVWIHSSPWALLCEATCVACLGCIMRATSRADECLDHRHGFVSPLTLIVGVSLWQCWTDVIRHDAVPMDHLALLFCLCALIVVFLLNVKMEVYRDDAGVSLGVILLLSVWSVMGFGAMGLFGLVTGSYSGGAQLVSLSDPHPLAAWVWLTLLFLGLYSAVALAPSFVDHRKGVLWCVVALWLCAMVQALNVILPVWMTGVALTLLVITVGRVSWRHGTADASNVVYG